MKKLHPAAYVVLCGFIATEVCATLSDGLVLHYRFDETFSGTLQNDGTGTFAGSPVGATQTTAGYINKAYEFDGVDNHVLMQPSSDFAVQDHTVAAWVRSNDYGIPAQVVFSTLTVSFSHGGLELFVGNNRAGYGFRTSAGESTPIGTPQEVFSDVDDGTWHHVLATYAFESGSGNSTVQIFVDGFLEHNWVETRVAAVGYSGQVGHIGINYDSNAVYGRGFEREFSGTIDDVRLYDRVLAPVEIQALAAIPEPATFLIVLLGLVGIAKSRHHRRDS
jgi:hypothetical protein